MSRGKTRPRTFSPSRRGKGDEDDSNRWLGTYADAVTLLMAFFILLYAMSELDVAKFEAFVAGLQAPFGNVSSESHQPMQGGLLPETDGLQPDHTPPPLEIVSHQVVAAAREATIRQNLEEVRDALDEALEAEGLRELVEQRIEERGLRVSIASDDILFALGSIEINEVGRQVIRTVARTLDDFTHPLMVEGHTDDVPLERPDYTNWNLSTDRAVRVLSLMVERHGLPPQRVGAVGYGEYRPLHPNDSKTNRARNRRVDIVVLAEETPV
jgi:chemotaxis protein MotB